MHCDRVYSILTRGPFPSGEVTDVAVEIHLAHCVECRRLAEALRPLDRQSHEAISAEASRLPGYRGDHPEWNTAAAVEKKSLAPAPRMLRRVPRPLAPFRPGRFIATLLFGGLIGAVLTSINDGGSSAGRSGMVSASFAGQPADSRTEARVQAQLIYGLNLPRACNKLDEALFYPLSSDERAQRHLKTPPPSFVNQCCTQCHVAGGPTQIGPSHRTKLVSSCVICHSESPRTF
jgi:anti-sigma factor RsiW